MYLQFYGYRQKSQSELFWDDLYEEFYAIQNHLSKDILDTYDVKLSKYTYCNKQWWFLAVKKSIIHTKDKNLEKEDLWDEYLKFLIRGKISQQPEWHRMNVTNIMNDSKLLEQQGKIIEDKYYYGYKIKSEAKLEKLKATPGYNEWLKGEI
jgi:hypothetical protein